MSFINQKGIKLLDLLNHSRQLKRSILRKKKLYKYNKSIAFFKKYRFGNLIFFKKSIFLEIEF